MARRPGLLVPTSLQSLIHLPSPSPQAPVSRPKPTTAKIQPKTFNLQSFDPRAVGVELTRISLNSQIVRAGY
ncbi:MAG: hypothetical protein NTW83_13425 [Cyanobacteria bacterium]|nr:hypothetical protein [Cyanobacteriota bacterium]